MKTLKYLLITILLLISPSLFAHSQTTVVSVTPSFIPFATSQHVLTASLCDQGATTANVFTCKQSGGAAFPNGVSTRFVALSGSLSLPSLSANTATIVGPPSTSFTAWSLQL